MSWARGKRATEPNLDRKLDVAQCQPIDIAYLGKNASLLLNYQAVKRSVLLMKKLVFTTLLAAVLAAPASAQCYAEYKAKQDDPLRLHYGIVLLDAPDCPEPAAAKQAVNARLAGTGWKLLNVIGVSAQTPDKTQKANAGEFYLRF